MASDKICVSMMNMAVSLLVSCRVSLLGGRGVKGTGSLPIRYVVLLTNNQSSCIASKQITTEVFLLHSALSAVTVERSGENNSKICFDFAEEQNIPLFPITT